MRLLTVAVFALALAAQAQAASTITYQGQLQQGSSPFTGSANLEFRLFDAASGGSQIGPTQSHGNWPISSGLFQVELDFGAGAFDSAERYLETRVNGTPLSPRQAVSATPRALVAATTVAGAIGTSQINSAQVQRRVSSSCPAHQSIRSIGEDGSRECVGGGSANHSVLSGGSFNDASAQFSVVSGGVNNTASGYASTVGGGLGNCAGGQYSWAGGRNAKVRPGTAAGDAGIGCDGIPIAGQFGDSGTFVWGDNRTTPFISTGFNQFLIRAGGGVGINTNSPSGALEVIDGNTIVGGLDLDDRLGVGTDNPWNTLHVVANADQGPFRFSQGSSDGIVMRGHSHRGVSIGGSYSTANVPATGLRVAGRVRVSSFADQSSINLCRSADGTLALCTSSARYKRDIETLTVNADRLGQLRPVRYRWRDRDEADVGLIAEEVAELFPDLVFRNEEGQIDGIIQSGLTAVLIAGYQALKQDTDMALDTLMSENAELRAELAVLKVQSGQVRELERRLAAMEERDQENNDLRERLATLEALLLDGTDRVAGGIRR